MVQEETTTLIMSIQLRTDFAFSHLTPLPTIVAIRSKARISSIPVFILVDIVIDGKVRKQLI
jgi:hypothetical protein